MFQPLYSYSDRQTLSSPRIEARIQKIPEYNNRMYKQASLTLGSLRNHNCTHMLSVYIYTTNTRELALHICTSSNPYRPGSRAEGAPASVKSSAMHVCAYKERERETCRSPSTPIRNQCRAHTALRAYVFSRIYSPQRVYRYSSVCADLWCIEYEEGDFYVLSDRLLFGEVYVFSKYWG